MMKRELKGQGYTDPGMEPESLQWSPSQTQKVLILFLTSSEHKAKIYSSSERTFKVYTYPVLTDVSIMSAWSLDPIESRMIPHHIYNCESATTVWLQREVKNKAVPSVGSMISPFKGSKSGEQRRSWIHRCFSSGGLPVLGMLMHSSGWGGQSPLVESGFKTKQKKPSLKRFWLY